ncbi:hypothetical protein EYZ11_005334 [Aspergillus tanneri]|uniref:Major facilitator superfamily (MFS) profile domain-containing protein n=1 Tax=Aspergillus tanneri TaxID=1220188 RepID=A0A4S3JIT0_9EURO|nr:uncharacterized protein ATNIH1004_001029 [Aspergillus tanneri]KAA8652125.1 hypothetical protein ATNIH1004_001029 [Aspergillus tanneri]THC95175.1 hypothetical protein EYZ11_005334 [Aspergillus tanneri]
MGPSLGCDNVLLVEFNGPDNPEHPQNWTLQRQIWVLGMFNFISTVSSSIVGKGYIFGFLTFGPLSEKFGRKYPLIQSFLLGLFFAGFFGVSPAAVLGGVVSDCFTLEHRGITLACAVALMFSGPSFGRVVGGFVTGSSLGWGWTMGLVIISGLVLSLLSAVTFPETYAPIILQKWAQVLHRQSAHAQIKASIQMRPLNFEDIARHKKSKNSTKLQPILTLLTLYQSFHYGILFLFYSAYLIDYGDLHGWSTGLSTVLLVGIITGVFLGTLAILLYEIFYFRLYYHTHKINTQNHNKNQNETYVPEIRLPPMIIGSLLIPLGILWNAWTSAPNTPWPSPVCAGVLIGSGS